MEKINKQKTSVFQVQICKNLIYLCCLHLRFLKIDKLSLILDIKNSWNAVTG